MPSLFAQTLTRHVEDGRREPACPAILFEVQGVQLHLREVAHGKRVYVLRLHTKEQAGENVAVVPLLHKILDKCEDIRRLLNLVNDNDGLMGNEGRTSNNGHAQ